MNKKPITIETVERERERERERVLFIQFTD